VVAKQLILGLLQEDDSQLANQTELLSTMVQNQRHQ
jgi:hypothetical protein